MTSASGLRLWLAPSSVSLDHKYSCGGLVLGQIDVNRWCTVNFFFVSSLSVTFAYLLDLYGDKTDNVMIIVNGFKNFAAFGVSFAIVPWTTRSGYAIPLGVLAAIVVVGHLLMVLCYCFTRRLSTKNGFGQSMNYDGGLNEEIVREGVPTELKESASYLESC